MIRSWLRFLLIGVAALLVSVTVLSLWLLHTESGARFLWSRATAASPGQLEAKSFTGSVGKGILVRGVEYKDATLNVEIGELSFHADVDLFGLALNVHELHARDVYVQPGPASDSQEPGPTVDEVLPSLQLPLTLRLFDFSLQDATLAAPDGATVFALEALRFDAEWDDALTIERLAYSATDLRATAVLNMELDAPYAIDASGELEAGSSMNDWLPKKVNVTLSGDLENLQLALASSEPSSRVTGSVGSPLDEAELDLLVTTSAFPLPPGDETATLRLVDLNLRIRGTINDYSAEVDALLESDFAAPLAITAELVGNLQSLRAERLGVSSDDVEASLRGTLGWADELTASASLEVARFDPQRWLAEWPDAQFLRGQAELDYNESRIEVAGMQIGHSDSTAALQGSGVVDTRDGVVAADLSWQDLQWPMPPAAAAVASRAANLNLAGTLNDWQLSGEIELGAPDLPEGRFVLTGGGSRETVALQIQDSEVLGGRVVGDLEFDARAGGRWSAKLQTTDTRITPFVPEWPGVVSADFAANGIVEPFALELRIASLTGEIRGRALQASGGLYMAGKELRFADLNVRSGGSHLHLDGDWNNDAGVSFGVSSESLADILPGAAGSIQADGRFVAGRDWPLVELALEGSGLGWQEWYAENLTVRNVPGGTGQPFGLSVAGEGVTVAAQMINSLGFSLIGSPAAHQLELVAQMDERQLGVELSGGIANLQPFDQAKWTGTLSGLRLSGRDDLALTLRDSAALELSAAAASLTRACLDIGQGGAFCAAGQLTDGSRYRAKLELSEVPLNVLRAFTGTNLQFTQLLSGSMELATGPRGRPSGRGRIDMTPGQIVNDIDERLTLRTRAGFASFDLLEGQLLAGELSLPFSDAAEIAGTFRVIDVTQGQDSPVEGHLTAVIRDLGVSARIFPQIDEAGGSLDADIQVGGSLQAPEFAGGFGIRDGRLSYDPLGLKLSDIQLDSKVLAGNRIELQSTFRAGDGQGSLRSSADYLQGRSGGFEVSLTGENLDVIDLPDLNVVINPDLELGVRGDDIRINGKVVVPSARLSSVKFVNTGVSESDDVVYVGAVKPDGASEELQASPLNYSGSMVLELGDNIVIDLDLAEARLRGSARYTWEGPAMPMATGSFGASGKFEAYGQLLEIREGTIRYANVPASNPELRVRAEREIFGNSQVRRAGVFVSGTALRPKLEVYTAPATTPDRALTLLVTGSDFNYEQGVGAVDVGTYIAPRLYASYGIGLFDRENVISVRYDLAKGFGVKATSGKRAAGIDLSYTIER